MVGVLSLSDRCAVVMIVQGSEWCMCCTRMAASTAAAGALALCALFPMLKPVLRLAAKAPAAPPAASMAQLCACTVSRTLLTLLSA